MHGTVLRDLVHVSAVTALRVVERLLVSRVRLQHIAPEELQDSELRCLAVLKVHDVRLPPFEHQLQVLHHLLPGLQCSEEGQNTSQHNKARNTQGKGRKINIGER